MERSGKLFNLHNRKIERARPFTPSGGPALHGKIFNATFRPRTHGNVFLRFCIVYCFQGNREQPAHYLKQYKNAGKRFRVYGASVARIEKSILRVT